MLKISLLMTILHAIMLRKYDYCLLMAKKLNTMGGFLKPCSSVNKGRLSGIATIYRNTWNRTDNFVTCGRYLHVEVECKESYCYLEKSQM